MKVTVFLFFFVWGSVQAQTIYSLQKTLQTTRTQNPYLKTEHYNIAIEQADALTARLRPNPNLNNQTLQLMQPSHFYNGTSMFNGKNQQVWWQLTKTIQLPAQRKYKIEVANKTVAWAEKKYEETERNVLFDVSLKWLEAWTAQKQLDLVRTAQNNIDSLVESNRLRFKNQVITQTDLFRTELLSKQYAIQYTSATQELRTKQKELSLLMGISDSVQIDTTDAFGLNIPSEIDSLLALSLQHRSDIIEAGSLIELANSDIQFQKSKAIPQPEVGFIWNPQNKIQYFGIYATIALPFFNRNQGEIEKSKAIKAQAEQYLNTKQKQLRTEITNAYTSYQIQKRNIQHFQAVLSQSEDILNNVKYAYLKGGTTIIDFLEAQRSWLETQQRYYETLQEYRQSYIQLLYVTGLINQLAK